MIYNITQGKDIIEILEINAIWLILLLVIIFTFVYKKLTKNPDAITSKFVANKTVSGSPSENLKLIGKAMENAGFKRVGLDLKENRFYAQTKFSMYSFSEYIEITVTGHFSTNLKFKSICALPTQIVAWGKNRRNYKKFERELEMLLASSSGKSQQIGS